MRRANFTFLLVAMVQECSTTCFGIRSETMPRVTLQTIRNCFSAEYAMMACDELPTCQATLFSASDRRCLLFGDYYTPSTVTCTAPYNTYRKGTSCGFPWADAWITYFVRSESCLGPNDDEFALASNNCQNNNMIAVLLPNGTIVAEVDTGTFGTPMDNSYGCYKYTTRGSLPTYMLGARCISPDPTNQPCACPTLPLPMAVPSTYSRLSPVTAFDASSLCPIGMQPLFEDKFTRQRDGEATCSPGDVSIRCVMGMWMLGCLNGGSYTYNMQIIKASCYTP